VPNFAITEGIQHCKCVGVLVEERAEKEEDKQPRRREGNEHAPTHKQRGPYKFGRADGGLRPRGHGSAQGDLGTS